MKHYQVTVKMMYGQTISKFVLQVQASDLRDAINTAIRTLNNCLTYNPVDSLIRSISVKEN